MKRRDIVSMLIKAGAIVDHKDYHRKTAFDYALEKEYRACAFVLLRAGATLKLPPLPYGTLNQRMKAIKKCGGWQRHVELHRGRALRIISACVGDALPEDAKGHVVDLWVLPGGC
jgi:ankyrin repeat protein